MVDNPKDKDSKVEGKDNPKTWTPPEGKEWLLEKFSKAENPTEEQAKAYTEAEKRLREVEGEVTKLKTGGAQNLREALAEKEDELARLRGEVETLRKPQSSFSAEQQSFIKNWHQRLISEDPVEAARAVQEAIQGEITLYDKRKGIESEQERLERQLERAESKLEKEELVDLLPYITRIREERPDLIRSRYGVEDIVDKAKIRLAEDKKAMEIEDEIKKHQKEEAQTTSPEGATGKSVEISAEELEKMPIAEREKLLRDAGIKFV